MSFAGEFAEFGDGFAVVGHTAELRAVGGGRKLAGNSTGR
jgi:hypothetical protein